MRYQLAALFYLTASILTAASQSTAGRTFTVDPTLPQDLISQVNGAIAGCPAGGPCSIRIAPGIYNVESGTIHINSPAISITGDGVSSVVINYRGTNFLDLNLKSHFTISPVGRVGGFTVNCVAAGALCITAGSVVGARFEDLNVVGPGGQDSKLPCNRSTAFQFENAPGMWMERWQLRDIDIGGFCTNLHFKNSDSGGTSFGYGLVDGLWTNQGAGSRGVDVDAGAAVYHVLGWTQNLNAGGTTAADEAFHVAGVLDGTGFGFEGETGSASITFAHLLTHAHMMFSGGYRVYGPGATGAKLDPGAGVFFIGPFSGDAGVVASTYPVGSISNFGLSSKTVDVFPVEQAGGLEAANPGITAGRGYVVSRTPNALQGSPSSPFFVFDPGIPLCFATIEGSSMGRKLSEASPVFCVDGTGSIVQANGATLRGPVSASAYRENLSTPASSSAPCSPGQFTDDANFHYVCVSANSWKRVALSSF